MFTLKFYRDGFEAVYSCEKYEVQARFPMEPKQDHPKQSGATVIVYSKSHRESPLGDGVEVHLGEPKHPKGGNFDSCFVMNESGKTIDRIGPFSKQEPTTN